MGVGSNETVGESYQTSLLLACLAQTNKSEKCFCFCCVGDGRISADRAGCHGVRALAARAQAHSLALEVCRSRHSPGTLDLERRPILPKTLH